jgi:AcrR family transcriptional regulator
VTEARTPEIRRRRPGGRATRVRTAVLAATLTELTQSGYGGLSAARIADRAGVHRSTIHRRWADLDELIADALLEDAAAAIPIPDTGNARDDLTLLLRAIARYIDTDPARPRIRALIGDAARSPAIGAVVKSVWTTRFHAGEAVIARAVARGEIRGNIPPPTLIDTLLGPLYIRLLLTDQRIDDEFIRVIIDVVLDGARSVPGQDPPQRPPRST